MTFGEWLDTWVALYVVSANYAPSTVAMYRRAVNAVPKTLRDKDLKTLSALDLQKWLVQVTKRTPRAAQINRGMLVKALHTAQKMNLCSITLDQDTLPKPAHKAKQTAVFTPDQAQLYVKAIAAQPCYILLLLCLVCGLRRGEALGLRWEDLDKNTGILTVNHQRQRIAGAYVLRNLKTSAAHRAMRLPTDLVRIIDAQPRSMTGYLVDTTPERMQHDHVAALRSAALPRVTLHGLRHTMATLSAASGCSMKILQATLGHSTIHLTADLYAAHLLPPSSAPALVWQGLAVI